jgi:hypothetical protein
MMKISNRLMSIDMNEMERLTYQTRKILLRSYLQRGIAPPFWIVAPNRPRGRTGEPQQRFSGVMVCLDVGR